MDINFNIIQSKNDTKSQGTMRDMRVDKKRQVLEYVARKKMFLLNACIAVISVAAITFFVFYKGCSPSFQEMQREPILL